MLLELIATATPIAHAVEATPKAPDPLLVMVLGLLGGSVVPLVLFLFGRIHHQDDRHTDRSQAAIDRQADQAQAAVGREVHHLERAEDRDERGSNREMDRVWATLDRLQDGLDTLRATTESNHGDTQAALLRIETIQAAIKAYVESEKELRRLLGATRAGVN